jgi:hypothetical protein
MEIISHRGYWIIPKDKNTQISFLRSFKLDFGTETDIRDYNGELVISHDIATSESMKLDLFFKLYIENGKSNFTLALNIKSDGLQVKLQNLLNDYGIKNYFVFDMSIPDTLGYISKNINFFSRQSEYELSPAFYNQCNGIWLDSFIDIWFTRELIIDHLKNKKKIALVSPELHGRKHTVLWEFLKVNHFHKNEDIMLCTDFPEEAVQYFNS